MRSRLAVWTLGALVCAGGLAFLHPDASARPSEQRHELSTSEPFPDIVHIAPAAKPRTAAVDTIWIATWEHDVGGACSEDGWEHTDSHVLATGTVYWRVDGDFDGLGSVQGDAAVLGYTDEVCFAEPNGYDNVWYQAIRMEYSGAATLSFDYVLDSEGGFDFLQVEVDSACAAADRVDKNVNPVDVPSNYRTNLFSDSGENKTGSVSALVLTDFGTGMHCVYIAFFSDGAFAPSDGLFSTTIGAALVVDGVVVEDASGTRSEDFADGTLDIGTFVEIQASEPFGEWGRTYDHITDNDACTENTTCALLWTDDKTPTIANDPSMAFAPGGYVIRNWLENTMISPWVSLASTPGAQSTRIQFRRFPGNFFSTSRMTANWSVRSRKKVDGIDCVSGWGHAFQNNSLSLFSWLIPSGGNPPNSGYDMSSDFDPSAEYIQVRHRVSDWQFRVGAGPPARHIPGPGPFVDATRVGRIFLSGPVIDEGIDARSQAQDAFPTEIHPGITSGTGEHHRPTTDRFGATAFSRGTELGINYTSPNLITGDSITIEVQDVRGTGGITSVEWFGAIAAGPHAGKAPPPYSVGGDGFFTVIADSSRNPSSGQVIDDFFFVDLDDDYFRGGDVLHYFWLATDAGGGTSSLPLGLTSVPATRGEAEIATGGLFEVSFLPTIDWDAGFLGRIDADPHGKLEPTEQELQASSQAACILYVNRVNARRRSLQRTSFTYTLDMLGYGDAYDVYDHSGMGNTNNHLGGRATVEQAQGYSLIVYDAGAAGPSGTIMPEGNDLDVEKVDQASWFRSWLQQAALGEAGRATLWVLGSDVLQEKPNNPLYTSDMGVMLETTGQALDVNPEVEGVTSFAFLGSGTACDVEYSGDVFTLNGGCPVVRDYDGLGDLGSAVVTHRFRSPQQGVLAEATIVMNTDAVGRWNTIFQSHPWFDIVEPGSVPGSPQSEELLLSKTLQCVLPLDCAAGDPTDVRERSSAPPRTVLHANAPNPFNPTTTIRFDLAQDAHVRLRIFDVSGRLVRTLVDAPRRAGFDQRVLWNGMDDGGRRVPSGVYVSRLEVGNRVATRKMVLMQ